MIWKEELVAKNRLVYSDVMDPQERRWHHPQVARLRAQEPGEPGRYVLAALAKKSVVCWDLPREAPAEVSEYVLPSHGAPLSLPGTCLSALS